MAEIKKTEAVKAEAVKTAEPVKETKTAVPAAEAPEQTAAAKSSAKKPAAKKAPAKKTAKTTAAKAAATKTAAKAAGTKTATAKTTKKAAKQIINLQFAGKSYSMEDLQKIAGDVWKYDLHKNDEEYKSLELYVKPEESIAYYVFNGDITGSFFI